MGWARACAAPRAGRSVARGAQDIEFGRSFVNIVDVNSGGTLIDMLRVHETEAFTGMARASTTWQGPGHHHMSGTPRSPGSKHSDESSNSADGFSCRLLSCFGALFNNGQARTLPVTSTTQETAQEATQERETSSREES